MKNKETNKLSRRRISIPTEDLNSGEAIAALISDRRNLKEEIKQLKLEKQDLLSRNVELSEKILDHITERKKLETILRNITEKIQIQLNEELTGNFLTLEQKYNELEELILKQGLTNKPTIKEAINELNEQIDEIKNWQQI